MGRGRRGEPVPAAQGEAAIPRPGKPCAACLHVYTPLYRPLRFGGTGQTHRSNARKALLRPLEFRTIPPLARRCCNGDPQRHATMNPEKKKNSVLGLPLGAAAARIFTQTQTGAALPQGPTRSQAPSRCILLRGPGPASDSDGASLPTTASAPGTGHRVQDRHERRHLMICTSGCLSLASWTPLLVLQIVQIVPHSSNCS